MFDPSPKRGSRFPRSTILALLMLLVGITLAGIYWFRIAQRDVSVGNLSPDGKQFIAYIYGDGVDVPLLRTEIRDTQTGRLVHDLSDIRWAQRGGPLAWSPDGSRIVGLGEQINEPGALLKTFELQLRPQRKTIQALPAIHSGASAFYAADGSVTHVIDRANSEGGRQLKFLNDGQPTATVSYGADEQPFVWQLAAGGEIIVTFRPAPTATPNGDFAYCNATRPAVVTFEAKTGTQLQSNVHHDCVGVTGTTSLQWTRNPTLGVFEVYRTGDRTTPLLQAKAGILLSFAHDQLIIWDNETIHAHDLQSQARKSFKPAGLYQVHSHGDAETLFYSTVNGRLFRLDLATGNAQRLFDARPGYLFAGVIAAMGIPCLGLAWIISVYRNRSLYPLALLGVFYLMAAIVLLIWAQVVPTENIGTHNGLAALVQIMLTIFLAHLLVWISTFRSIWGVGIPLATVSMSLLLLLGMPIPNPHNTGPSFVSFLVVAVMQSAWQVAALAVFRPLFGVLSGPDSKDVRPQSQITLRQIVVLTAGCGLLFACLRFGDYSNRNLTGGFLIWAVCFAAIYGVALTFSLWAAFSVKNGVASLCFACIPTGLAAALVWQLSRDVDVFISDAPLELHLQPLCMCLLLWLSLRICRAFGFRLQHVGTGLSS